MRRKDGKRTPLTAADIAKATPGAKPLKLWDERGLFLLVTPAGGKLWRFKYSRGGKEKLISLGAFPDVSLKLARERRDEARRMVADGGDPSEDRQRKRESAANTFESVARDWFAKQSKGWAPSHSRTVIRRLELHLFPFLGARPIAEIEAPEILAALKRVETAGRSETVKRLRQIASEVFLFAVASGLASRDPAGDLRRAVAPAQKQHRAAIIQPGEGATPAKLREVGALLRALDGYNGSIIVRCALRLAPLVFVRPGELRQAEWSEIDFDRALWEIRWNRMKRRRPLIVPLARQAVEILRQLQPVTGDGVYVFPSGRSTRRPMSDNAVLSALRRSGIEKHEMSGHGFRAIARTILDEVLGFRVDIIEHQLAHAVRDATGAAYNRTAFLADRVVMMQRWADYLDELRRHDFNAQVGSGVG